MIDLDELIAFNRARLDRKANHPWYERATFSGRQKDQGAAA